MTGKTETISASTEGCVGALIEIPIELPDLEINCEKQIPTLSLIPSKDRLCCWDVFIKSIDGCVQQPNCAGNWKKLLPLMNAYYEHLIGVKIKSNKIGKTYFVEMLERWKAEDYDEHCN